MNTLLRFVLLPGLLTPFAASAVLITNNTTLAVTDAALDGMDIVVSNATLTVDGPHAFASLRVEPGGVLTHTAIPNGQLTLTNRFADEPQTLVGTNDVVPINPNVTAIVAVRDMSGTITYVEGVDYIVTVIIGQVSVRRTEASAIVDGAMVLITYDVITGTIPTGLTITVTNDFTVAAGGAINVAGCGFSGSSGTGHGGYHSSIWPWAGCGGGGHGGVGGIGGVTSSNSAGGVIVGLYDQPTNHGGAGGYLNNVAGASGGAGGGTVRFTCLGTLTLDGVITANGNTATNSRAGGGAGGSVWITATNFAGTGLVTVNGGAGEPPYGGGGAGGRIAVEFFSTNLFAGTLEARGGAGQQRGGAGTVFVRQFGAGGSVTVDNGGFATSAGTQFTPLSAPDVTVRGGATLQLSGSQTVGNLFVRSNSTVMPAATNSATLTLGVLSNVVIEATARITVSGRGASANVGGGLGATGAAGSGSGHGGLGGNGIMGITNVPGGMIYGSVTSPSNQGSGGRTVGSYIGGAGGGILRLIVNQDLQLDGEISANATAGMNDRAGGGSGGSIWITVSGNFTGGGSISANGGAGGAPYGGGGAGGRVAVLAGSNAFTGTMTARGATGAMAGGAGTVYRAPASGAGELTYDNGGLVGARSPLSDFTSYKRLALDAGATVTLSNSSSMTYGSITVGSNASLLQGLLTQTLTITGDVSVAAGGAILAEGLNPNYLYNSYGGGGHGGAGGRALNSLGSTGTMDNVNSPNLPGGSGGAGPAGYYYNFGRGGGALTMNISGRLTVDGRISVNGTDSTTNFTGGGAGGSLAITANGFGGAGILTADGGSGCLIPGALGGGGGGGRIAVTCNAPSNTFTGSFSTKGGNGYQRGGAGTVYLKPATGTSPTILVDNGGFAGTNTVINAGTLYSSYALVIQGGGWVSTLTSYNYPLNSLLVRSNSWLAAAPFAAITVFGDTTIEAGGGINLNAISSSGSGNGSMTTKGGGGHGGYGGGNSSNSGNAYDLITSPQFTGSSGGGLPYAGYGGGAVRLTVNGMLQLDGRISADGGTGEPGTGAGSGGSVWLTLNKFAGNGTISANGGSAIPALGLGGGGGGGRIAVTWNPTLFGNTWSNLFTGTMSARGGDGVMAGGAGTIYLKRNDQSFATVTVDNGGYFGTNTPMSSNIGMPTGLFNLGIANGASTVFLSTPNLLSNLTVAANGRILSTSSSFALTTFGDLAVNAGGTILADGRGSARGVGPGAGASLNSKGAGGGHGGAGGASASGAPGGVAFEFSAQPIGLGGGGGAGANAYSGGCEGGGAMKLTVAGTATIDGNLSANGNPGLQDDSGGGAGGSIWMMTKALAGSGVIAADGGDGELYGGGGGGAGRIALYANSTNGFTGLVSVLGGDGASAGQNGTVVFTTNMLPFEITSHSPTGLVNNTVGTVTFNFSQLVNAATVSPAAFAFSMPSNYAGPLPGLTATLHSSTSVGLAFTPSLNFPGDYTVTVNPVITDIYGTPMSQVYTGAFTVAVPTVEGFVRDTNGTGVAGVTVRTPDFLPVSTDATGFYSLGLPPGWSGSFAPSLGANMFVPGSIALINITAPTTNQNFLMVDTIVPVITSGASSTNITLDWSGMPGVTYYIEASTNIVDWIPWLGPLTATNAPIHVDLPFGSEPQGFFRLRAAN